MSGRLSASLLTHYRSLDCTWEKKTLTTPYIHTCTCTCMYIYNQTVRPQYVLCTPVCHDRDSKVNYSVTVYNNNLSVYTCMCMYSIKVNVHECHVHKVFFFCCMQNLRANKVSGAIT